MDIEQFLARVVPSGNYAVAVHAPVDRPGLFVHRFFPADKRNSAAGFMKWSAAHEANTYFATASYRDAEPIGVVSTGRPKYVGERKQSNVQELKCFWMDLDVKRDGDKKKVESVYATRETAITWLRAFCAATHIPLPNLYVDSGYGFHVYWIFEDPLSLAAWQPYADALVAAMRTNNFTGDSGITADGARILRPPGTLNRKGPAPVEVRVIPASAAAVGDFPNALLLDVLRPFVGTSVPASGPTVGSQKPASAGNNVIALHGNAKPAFAMQTASAPMAAAATANMPARRPHEFIKIAAKCLQVQQSLTNNGDGDQYPLWYLGHLSLAHYTTDGSQFVHEISRGDPRYDPATTDAAVARIAVEQARKDVGPPRCTTFDRGRPGVCGQCPHYGKVASPWTLGADDGDLPEGYRRHGGSIQRRLERGENTFWTTILVGDVYQPTLDLLPPATYVIGFVYERAGRKFYIRVEQPSLPADPGALGRYLGLQGITNDNVKDVIDIRDFIMAWLNALRDSRSERSEVVHPFGWLQSTNNDHTGFAVAGTVYRPDGSTEAVPGADPVLAALYEPRGSLDAWKDACDYVTANRPDLQILVAASFASPLVHLTGQASVVLSARSQQTGVGKTSAMIVAQAVWSSQNVMSSMMDTPLSVQAKAASTQVMPVLWDEMRVGREQIDNLVTMIFTIVQGKEKSRLDPGMNLRAVRNWETMLVCTGNQSLVGRIAARTEDTEAGSVRVFEYPLAITMPPNDASSALRIGQAKTNYGRAGRVFAAYLGTHHVEAGQRVLEFATAASRALRAEQGERLYVATIAALLAAAHITNKLGLTKFDMQGIWVVLATAFNRLRRERQRAVLATSDGYDISQVLAMFAGDNLAGKLTTTRFGGRGRAGPDMKILHQPLGQTPLAMHVSQLEQVMRIRRDILVDWCREHDVSWVELFHRMEADWQATQTRENMGGGTPWATGRIYVVDVPLVHPDTVDYIGDRPNDPVRRATPIPPGNQARV